jgi:hypothetical protein
LNRISATPGRGVEQSTFASTFVVMAALRSVAWTQEGAKL